MTTAILDSEIVFDRTTKDYAILIAGVAVGFAPNYSEAEAIRTQALAERRDEGHYATATELDPDDGPPDIGPPDDIPGADPSPGRWTAEDRARDAMCRAWSRALL